MKPESLAWIILLLPLASAIGITLFTRRQARLSATLAKLDTAALASRRYVVYHDAWPYLFDWLGAAQAGTVEPLPGVPSSSKHLSELAAMAKAKRVDAVLHTSYDDLQAIKWLGKNAGMCGIELPYTVGGSPQATTLIAFYGDIVSRLNKGC